MTLESGSLSLLEPSGPVQTCNGIALPLPLPSYEPKMRALGTYGKAEVRTAYG